MSPFCRVVLPWQSAAVLRKRAVRQIILGGRQGWRIAGRHGVWRTERDNRRIFVKYQDMMTIKEVGV